MSEIENIVKAFMKVINEPENCYHDEFNRAKTNLIICWNSCCVNHPNFHIILIKKLKNWIKELYVVRDSNDTTTFNYKNYEVNMNYISDFDGTYTLFTFTRLLYHGDTRDFE